MAQPAKYLFDSDFGTSTKSAAISLADHAAKLKEAEAAGYRNGFAAAQAEAAAEGPRRTAVALERIAAALDTFNAGLTAVEARLEAEAVEVASAIAMKLVPELIAREPFTEIAALVNECIRHLVQAPHIVVRVNDAVEDTARRELEALVRARGFAGRLLVLAEPEIALGDCRIEWADGGITRDRGAAEAAIHDAVHRYIAGRGGRRAADATNDETASSHTADAPRRRAADSLGSLSL